MSKPVAPCAPVPSSVDCSRALTWRSPSSDIYISLHSAWHTKKVVAAFRINANKTFINDIKNKILCATQYSKPCSSPIPQSILKGNPPLQPFQETAAQRAQAFCLRSHSPVGQKAGMQSRAPSYPTIKGLTCPSALPHRVPTMPFQSPPRLTHLGTLISWCVQNPAWKPLTYSLCFSNQCPRSDPFLTEPPPSPQPDPHVMKGINMAKPPAQPSSFPAALARPLID